MQMSKNKTERPKYIIKVHRGWEYGPRARFWDIQEWRGDDKKGYWASVSGGLAYTEWGMWRAINRRLKKMQFGYENNYFSLDKKQVKEIF
jgi:hypothetical protein